MRRILSLWLERWPTDRIHRRRQVTVPLVTAATIGNRRLLMAVDRAAALAGLAPGMTLADARARVPDVASVEADPVADAAALVRLADWCTRYSPLSAVADGSGIWLDITGCVPLFESEQVLADDLLRRLGRQGLGCRAAVADTPGGAWAVARYAITSSPRGRRLEEGGPRAIIVPPGETRAALAPLPIAALRLADGIVEDLRRLGFRRIEMLYPIPRAPLAPRFGEIVARRLDQALGLIQEPISPIQPIEPRLERLSFAEPIQAADDLHRGMTWLIGRLGRRLEREGLGARQLELACYRADGVVERIAIGTSQPNRDPAHLTRLMAPRIESIDPGFGIELMVLRALSVAPQAASQIALGGETAAVPEAMAQLIDRLANRVGAANVRHLIACDSHVPERAQRLSAAFEQAPPAAWFTERPRPIRLLAHPDPIEAVAPVPDDPPLMFRWHKRLHRVRHAEGPERIAAEWWRMPGRPLDRMPEAIRDYYRIEDQDGRRYWVFRRGCYRPETSPNWFIHGFFA